MYIVRVYRRKWSFLRDADFISYDGDERLVKARTFFRFIDKSSKRKRIPLKGKNVYNAQIILHASIYGAYIFLYSICTYTFKELFIRTMVQNTRVYHRASVHRRVCLLAPVPTILIVGIQRYPQYTYFVHTYLYVHKMRTCSSQFARKFGLQGTPTYASYASRYGTYRSVKWIEYNETKKWLRKPTVEKGKS